LRLESLLGLENESENGSDFGDFSPFLDREKRNFGGFAPFSYAKNAIFLCIFVVKVAVFLV
jgi:hypothetical protein